MHTAKGWVLVLGAGLAWAVAVLLAANRIFTPCLPMAAATYVLLSFGGDMAGHHIGPLAGWWQKQDVRRKWLTVSQGLFGLGLYSFLAAAFEIYNLEVLAAVFWAIMGTSSLIFRRLTFRQWLGWTIDDFGERQKVESVTRGQLFFKPTDRTARLLAEDSQRKNRRRDLWYFGLLGWIPFALAGIAYFNEPVGDPHYVLTIVPAFPGAVFLCCWFYILTLEILYRRGFQDMEGAKVLDAPPIRPGSETVRTQKAQGGARVATETETKKAAAGPVPSSIHDQEF